MSLVLQDVAECDSPGCKTVALRVKDGGFHGRDDLRDRGWLVVELPDSRIKTFCPEHRDEAVKEVEIRVTLRNGRRVDAVFVREEKLAELLQGQDTVGSFILAIARIKP